VPHYGKLEEILVVSYDAHSKFEEYVFKCKWFKVNFAGANCTVVQDECGHTQLKTSAISLVNFRAIYFSQSCRTMLLSSLSPKPRGVVTCCHICATVLFYSR